MILGISSFLSRSNWERVGVFAREGCCIELYWRESEFLLALR